MRVSLRPAAPPAFHRSYRGAAAAAIHSPVAESVRCGAICASRCAGSLPDTESREDAPEQILASELTGDLRERLLRAAQLLGHQLPGAALGELPRRFLGVAARARQCIQVAAARADHPGLGALIPHALLEVRA